MKALTVLFVLAMLVICVMSKLHPTLETTPIHMGSQNINVATIK